MKVGASLSPALGAMPHGPGLPLPRWMPCELGRPGRATVVVTAPTANTAALVRRLPNAEIPLRILFPFTYVD